MRNHELCSPPVTIASTTSKPQGNEEKCKAKKRKIQAKEKDNEELVPATDLCQTEEGADKEGQTGTELNCLFVYFLREDGMWLRIGDVVSVEGVGLPFIIFRMFSLDGCITVKLVNIHNSGLREDFVITCSVSYVVDYVGEKVSLKGSVKEKVEQSAFVEFCNFMLSGVDSSVKVNMRKLVLGHAMRVGLQGGFGNLSCMRISLGPSDVLLDNKILNVFSMVGVRKFTLVGDGEFEFLDTIMGKGWDYKVGRGEDSFYKFITEIHVKRSNDLCLNLVAKFSQSQCVFNSLYRVECRKAVQEGKEQMENIIL